MSGKCCRVLAVVALSGFALGAEAKVERIFRAPRLTRGSTNVARVQPIDEAKWVWLDDATASVVVFRRSFEVKAGEGPLVIDVSADERFYLTCDGTFVARGPNRAAVENWQYQTYRLSLDPGEHELRAVVTHVGDDAPLAQLSNRSGFVLKAEGVFDGRLTTGKAKWEAGRFRGMWPSGADNGVWGTGSQFTIRGSGPFAVEPERWMPARVVRGPAYKSWTADYGSRAGGWMLFPTQLPDQMEEEVRPGEFRAAAYDAGWRSNHVYTAAETASPLVAEFNALLREGREVTIPARTRVQLAWHLGRYICAYPLLKTAKGAGARVSWTWTESARDAETKRKGVRSEIVGKYVEGYGDTFLPDGGEGEFSAPWFRCGLWSRLDVETAAEPLVIRSLSMIESRYPVEMESEFSSPDDPSLAGIRRICTRAMQMCCHEMLFDCPYYEQQMYPGDSRVELLTLTALSRDERMIRRVIEIFDLATRDDGQCPFNFPTRGTQEGFTYTLCYLLMYGDYAMNHADREWLRARLPGLRKSMAGCELYENAEGLVENTPVWNFMDWTVGWAKNGVLPDTDNGRRLNAFVNLFWLLAMESAATTERALGNELQARYWEAKAAKLKTKILGTFWDETRGLVADTPAKKTFSEHMQALAIIADLFPSAEQRDRCFRHLVEDRDLARCTVYFRYYLFEAFFRMGRADLFQEKLQLWRDYIALDVTTVLEKPDDGKTGRIESRSDCHAWGTHPVWFMQTGLAGIRSAAPFFEKVLVAPQPGSLKAIKAKHPHPQGWIELELEFDGGRAKGRVTTPVPGTFRFGGQELALQAGENRVE